MLFSKWFVILDFLITNLVFYFTLVTFGLAVWQNFDRNLKQFYRSKPVKESRKIW